MAILSIEALVSVLALTGFVMLLAPAPAPTLKEVYLYQLVQDVLEISVKSDENREKIIGFASEDKEVVEKIKKEYSRMMSALGDYCLVLEMNGKKLEANCAKPLEERREALKAERIVYDGRRFMVLQASISMN
ncbi:hypothetical protein HY991_02335 [Candidatus Micrarchaeota archaeon]|nr:hypothetical protein [Candidatus Micrarchaeota archaeon]